MLEIGPIGFFLWYLLRLRIVLLLWRTYTRLKLPLTREMALTAFLMHLLFLPSQVVFQITFTIYYWLFAGFILLLPRIEERQRQLDLEDELESNLLVTQIQVGVER